MTFLWHGQIYVLFAVAILGEYCMASADIQWFFTQVSESWSMGLLLVIWSEKIMECNLCTAAILWEAQNWQL